MTPRQRRRWLGIVSLLAMLTGGSLLRGEPSLLLLGLLVGAGSLAAYQIWRPWAGARRWLRVRYHSPTPPDPQILQECLLGLLDREAVVLRWVQDAGGRSLWLEVPAHLDSALPSVLGLALPELRLEPGPAPVPPAGVIAQARIAPTPSAADLRLAPLWEHLAAPAPPTEVRLVLHGAHGGALLWLGPGPAPAPFVPVRGLPTDPAWARLRAWLLAHYPWTDPWPTPGILPPLPLPATTGPEGAGLDTHAAYHIAPQPAPVPGDPYLELGVSTVTGEPIRLSITANGATPPPLWQGHFLSLGTGQGRYRPLAALAAQARALDAPIIALDPERRLLPALGEILRDPTVHPAWITRAHPRNSLRFNLLAVAPTPIPGYTPEGGALHLALTSALPLFEEFLARLGVSPWSTMTGGILVHDLALGLLLAQHRTRLRAARPAPAPTPANLYQQLRQGDDIRPLLDQECQAWRDPALAPACGPGEIAHQTYTGAVQALEASLERWSATPLPQQHTARDGILGLLQPLWEAPGFGPLWHATTAPAHYFNTQPATLLLTNLLAPDPTPRDRVLAGWYADYLFFNLVAAAHARQLSNSAIPPMLLLLDDLRAWWQGPLHLDHLTALGTTGICCAATDAELPGSPDGDQILQGFNTWWLYTLARADQALIRPYLAAIQSRAGELPLVHFPPDLALLRTRMPVSQLATVTIASGIDQAASREAA